MTIFLTIISGVVTFVLGQIVLKLLIEPVHDFRRTVADIALALIEYANIYANPGAAGKEVEKQASVDLRKLSSRLHAQMYLIPCYRFTSKVFRLPSRCEVTEVARNLIGLSNGLSTSSSDVISANVQRANRIHHLLGLPPS
ncbi:hypothetical protein H6F89_31355 [Cyanobacteria bacterium FACHB-63]|nr:hypothetical protein [Cyanobacteria bacterium FACHB-63]